MASVKELREQRAPLAARIQVLADRINAENRDFNSEERSEWERVNGEFNELTRKINVQETADDAAGLLSARNGGPLPGQEDTYSRFEGRDGNAKVEAYERAHALAVQSWFWDQRGMTLTPAHERACERLGFKPSNKQIEIRLPRRPGAQVRAQGEGTTAAGGALVPQGFVYNLERAMKSFNGVRQAASVLRTDTGAPMPWPVVNDTTNVGVLLAENTAVTPVDVAFGSVIFNAYKFSSNLLQVSNELIQDSAFSLVEELGLLLGERLGRAQAGYFTTGTGTSQPQGIVTGATLGIACASSTVIAPDEIFGLLHSVDPAYRADPSFGWMMHDQVLLAVRKLKDSQNRYLWEASLQLGVPDRLLGYPVYVNQSMASTLATGNKVMLAGAMSKMKIRDVGSVRLLRLDERYADLDQTGFLGFARSDSHLLDAGTGPIRYMKML